MTNPDATVGEGRARDGTLLYLAYYRGELTGWASDMTPAGTTFGQVKESPCGISSMRASPNSVAERAERDSGHGVYRGRCLISFIETV
jgi:hypothetical protein